MIIFNETNKINIKLYNQFSNFNEYNNYTKNEFSKINELLTNEYFEVPFYKRQLIWGEEIVFYPFTNKLFKIVSTLKNDTSIQLHPRKNETWYPIKKTLIFNGNKIINVPTYKHVVIPKCSIHCMKKGGSVFEIQDNCLFDNDETIRIYDVNGRKQNDYLNYVLPNNLNNLKLKINTNFYFKKNDIFIFTLDEFNFYKDKNLKTNMLYFIKKDYIKNLKLKGKYIAIPAIYLVKNEINKFN